VGGGGGGAAAGRDARPRASESGALTFPHHPRARSCTPRPAPPARPQTERDGILKQWQAKKETCRANIKLLPESLAILKDKELKDLQEEFRAINTDFKALGVMAERATLMEGAAERHGVANKSRMNNDELLDGALGVQQATTSKLRDALSQVEQTKETGRYTAATLEQDREKIKRIDQVRRARANTATAAVGTQESNSRQTTIPFAVLLASAVACAAGRASAGACAAPTCGSFQRQRRGRVTSAE
jgi:hypothetical protein